MSGERKKERLVYLLGLVSVRIVKDLTEAFSELVSADEPFTNDQFAKPFDCTALWTE